MGDGWVPGGLYRVLPQPVPGSHIEYNTGLKPYPRPNEGNSSVLDEVSQMGLDMGPVLTSESTHIDPESTSQTVSQMVPR